MKKAFAKINVMPRFLVIIASKRHHVRFFPQSGVDKNANPLPGTLVETGVTQPFENDFYLCAHTAIKGTARPVHYTIEKIRDTGYCECFKHPATRSSTSTHTSTSLSFTEVEGNDTGRPQSHSSLPFTTPTSLPCRVLRPHPLPAAYPVIARTTRGYVAMTQQQVENQEGVFRKATYQCLHPECDNKNGQGYASGVSRAEHWRRAHEPGYSQYPQFTALTSFLFAVLTTARCSSCSLQHQ